MHEQLVPYLPEFGFNPKDARFLGSPVDLGPAFGAGSGWGRIEVEASEQSAETLFVHLLVAQDATAAFPPIDPRSAPHLNPLW